MKALIPVLALFLLSIFVCNNSMAQKASYTSNGGLTLGFGGGMAYQKADLANSTGFGFDFILGSQLYKKEHAFLSVDWKFRFLAGVNKAYDHRINPDDTYSNIRYRFYTYDLELGLTLNRLRERTRIVLTGFLGAGITHGRTFTDLYDAGSNLYDFSTIDPNQDSKAVYHDLLTLSDGDFETDLVNKAAVLPTAGIFLGYQLSRSLTLGVEFKSNFYLTEQTGSFGIDLDNKAISGSGIDRNNYVSLGFRWSLGRGSSNASRSSYYSPGGTSTYPTASYADNSAQGISGMQPSVDITDPSADLYHTLAPSHTVRAIVKHVNGPENISFSQNGFPNNSFTYNVNTKSFVANVRLREGDNSLRIKATNQTASAEDLVIITLDKPQEVLLPAPRVEFTSPWQRQISSSSDRLDVTASVTHISSKADIELTQDGRAIPFEFYPVSGTVETRIFLNNGDNQLVIKVFNEAGSAHDELTIYPGNPEELALPTVRFVNPVISKEVAMNRFPLIAKTKNVGRRDDVSLRLNGALMNNFSFSSPGEISAQLYLAEGVNAIEITARNEAGFVSESTFLTYNAPVYLEPYYQEPVRQEPVRQEPVYHGPVGRNPLPEINILYPATYPFRTFEPSEEVRAAVLNVASKDHITLDINGVNTRNFNYSSSTRVLTVGVALREGKNIVRIKAENGSGSAEKEQVLMKLNRSCPSPLIRMIDPAQGQTETTQATYALRAEVQHIQSSTRLKLTVNGEAVSFKYTNNLLSSSIPLVKGTNILKLSARNECGEDEAITRINYKPSEITIPCDPPKVSFTLEEVNRQDATHELQGSVSGVKNKAEISLTLDGEASMGFQFVPHTGALTAKYKLSPGSHTVVVSANNACGTDSESASVTVATDEKPCGIRINPGNSAWQFCLVTPSGTFSQENLTNSNFSYSGRASSLYFLPIGGGGEAMVNGRPYTVKSGQYYLFTGNLEVSVSTNNPGSMGHWSVCISANRNPVSGNGKNRPQSPCEEQKKQVEKKETQSKETHSKEVQSRETHRNAAQRNAAQRKVTETRSGTKR